MGWKNVKEHYQIVHDVRVTEQGVCIGSPYIHNILVVSLDGAVTRKYQGQNEDLTRYQKEFHDDPETLKRLVREPDTFQTSIPVYTYSGGEIIEKQCEALGWPNVTHDGEMMHENTFSTDKAKVVAWAKRETDISIRYANEHITETQKKLDECLSRLISATVNREKLESDYPEIKPAE